MKRIATGAYQALREALPAVVWNKRPFESMIRAELREHPELLGALNFGDTKRSVADELVDRLVADEGRYQQVSLQLMLHLAGMDEFPNLANVKEPEDRARARAEAARAVAELRHWTDRHTALAEEHVKAAEARAGRAAQDSARRHAADELDELRDQFLALHSQDDRRARGYALEALLHRLFLLFDMEPRMAYDLALEQLDGSLTFDTDDYVVEARWRKDAVGRDDADVFAAKVRRKGKNALGLFVSVNGFASTALEQYRESTPFVTMDGTDLMCVLDRRIRLDDLLRLKRRHANETGSCHLPAVSVLG